MHGFTLVFAGLLGLMLAGRLALALVHLAHVARHRDQVPSEFAERITLFAHQKAADYTQDKTRLGMLENCAEAAFLVWATLGGLIAAIDAVSAAWLGTGLARGAATVVAFFLLSSILFLPFEIYRTFVIEARYGFNKLTWRLFVLDGIKGALLSLLLGVPLLLLVFWLFERMGELWWLWVWLAWLGFTLALVLIYPTFIAPLFNRFVPLADASLKARIDALLARTGFRAQGLFVMDGSTRSAHGNAYFTGFGKSKRIVFFDTLLERLEPAEIEAVLAHELGHFKRRHVAKMLAARFLLALGFLALLGWVMHQPWFFAGLGLPAAPHFGVALLAFFMVLPVFTWPLTPLASLASRRHEFEADAFAAAETRAGDLVSALVKLYRDNAATLTPHPVYSLVYDSHPPAAIRIAHLKTLGDSA